MDVAISEARKSQEPLKCGVVIARHGIILAQTYNSQRADNNATAHAEIKAIGEAGKRSGSKNLEQCVAFCTCEPCTMCLSALIFAKVEKIYYGISLSSISNNIIGFSLEEVISKAPRRIVAVQFMEQAVTEALNLGSIPSPAASLR